MKNVDKNHITDYSDEQMKKAGSSLSLSRRARGWTQCEMASRCGMGLSTLVAIEKGSVQVSMLHWIQALEAFDLQANLAGLDAIFKDDEALRKMGDLVPKRATARLKRAR